MVTDTTYNWVITEEELRRRRIPLAGTFNFREVGGYPTSDGGSIRRGLLYRSCALHRLDGAGQERLKELGIRTVIDLRDREERDRLPDMLDGIEAENLHRPMFDQRPLPIGDDATTMPSLAEIYELMISERGGSIAAAVAALGEGGALPAVVHCAAGKDRTGIVIALTLAAAGVPDHVIATDYAATEMFLDSQARELLSGDVAPMSSGQAGTSEAMLSAKPDLILSVLARVKELGGAEAYLVANGLDAQTIERLRAALVEPAAEENVG